ncbi:MAG: histidine phosphatase family protein [Pseudomonadota bacterium]
MSEENVKTAPTLWWVRHGPTHAKTMVGWSDIPADLSDAAKVARLAATLPDDTPVISSDLTRTVATADALAGDRPRLPHDPDLREMHFGAWELRAFAEIEAEDPAHITAFWSEPGEVHPPGGESWNDLTQRVNRAVDRLLARDEDIIIIAHFGVILTQIQRVTGISTEEAFGHRIEPLSLTTLRYGTKPQALGINHEP